MRVSEAGNLTQGDTPWIHFALLDGAGAPVTGQVFGDITNFKYLRAPDAAWSLLALSGANFLEVGDGIYRVQLGATALAHVGLMIVLIEGAAFEDVLLKFNVEQGNPGIVQVTITTEDSTPDPIPDVLVEIWNNAQTAVIWYGQTDASGQLTVGLQPGAYKVLLTKTRTTFTVPETLTVVGPTPETANFEGTPLSLPVPSGPGKCVLFVDLYQITGDLDDGASPEDVTYNIKRARSPNVVGGKLFSTRYISGSFGVDGRMEEEVAQGLEVTVEISDAGFNKTFTVPVAASLDLASV